jgi:hypothetical protein
MKQRVLTYAALFYAAGFLIHNADHIRRGFAVEPTAVLVAGSAAGLAQLVAIVAVLTRHRLAPLLAVAVGFPDAIGIAAVHLLPHWSSSLSDAFPGAHGTGVTAVSWVAAIAEVAGALAFGLAGLYALSGRRVIAPAPLH